MDLTMSENNKLSSLNILGPINSLGYGIASKNICGWMAKTLSEKDAYARLFPIGNINCENEGEAGFFQNMAAIAAEFDVDAPCLKIWHEFGMAERIGRGELTGYSFFEVDTLPENSIRSINSTDKMVVTSRWAKEIVEEQTGHKNVFEVPLGVDRSIFGGSEYSKGEKCIFFNCGKWEMRKGHDLLLEMFQKAFPEDQSVELWMMCDNPFLSPPQRVAWENHYKQDPRVRIINRVQTQQELADIMRLSTCGFFPSRAEGWNLELLELMSLGKPVIATNYSAHKSYCNESNCHLVTPTSSEPAFDGKFFTDKNASWASLTEIFDDFVEKLLEVHNSWKKDEDLTNLEGVKTAGELSWENTASQLINIIEQ
jgi:glycosyltransferase involved in cell wall biosynthesis